MTGFYISLSDNYFISSSCKSDERTGLQFAVQSCKFRFKLYCNWRSSLFQFWAHDQILIFFVWQLLLSSSCKAPSLVRGRVCNLQCNHASSSSSYIATDGQVSQFVLESGPPVSQFVLESGPTVSQFVLESGPTVSQFVLESGPTVSQFVLESGPTVSQFVLESDPLWGPRPDFNFLCLTITSFLLHIGHPHPYPPWTGWSSPKSKSR
jgi:hypothetical protein